MRFDIASLKQSNEFLNTLLDNIMSAVFVVDKRIRIHKFNDALKALFYKPEDKLLGEYCGNALGCIYTIDEARNCGTTSHCDACDLRFSLIGAIRKGRPTHKKFFTRDFIIKNRKITKYFEFSVKRIFSGGSALALVVLNDITDLTLQNHSLENLNRMKNELLGMAAHDLRNPIAGIKMYSSYLLSESRSDMDQRVLTFLQMTQNFSGLMLKLIDEMLDLAKIEAGKLNLEPVRGDYASFIKENVKFNGLIAERKGIRFELRVPKVIPPIDFDRSKMEQVMNNLIGNAVKYSNGGKKIMVAVKKGKEGLITEVKDEGAGISGSSLAKIFSAFERGEIKDSEGDLSAGLGLAIVTKIIEGHGGVISVKIARGHGTVARFTLPYGAKKTALRQKYLVKSRLS